MVTRNGSLTPICSLSNCSLSPSLTVFETDFLFCFGKMPQLLDQSSQLLLKPADSFRMQILIQWLININLKTFWYAYQESSVQKANVFVGHSSCAPSAFVKSFWVAGWSDNASHKKQERPECKQNRSMTASSYNNRQHTIKTRGLYTFNPLFEVQKCFFQKPFS